MADKNENLEVDIIDDAGKDGALDVVVDNAAGVEDWKAQFEAAQKKVEESDAKRVEAERLAASRATEIDRYKGESSRARTEAVSAEMLAIENALANTDHERNDAKAEYKAALEAGDYDAAAEAQSKLSDIAIKAQRIKEGKAQLERRAEDAKVSVDPVEQYVKQLSPAAASWVRSHPEVLNNSKELERAHYGAVYNKIAIDSPEYFQFVEKEMGYGPKATDDLVVDTQTRQRAAPAAPVSRGASTDTPITRTQVRLTAAQREAAEFCGLTDVEYAKNLLAIERENGTTH